MKPDHFLILYSTINSKWIKDLNVKPETIKILVGSTGSNLSDIGHNDIFLDMSPEARETKAKINSWDIKIESCKAKEMVDKTKREPTEWEKILANNISHKGLVSKLYKYLKQLNTKK